LATSGYALADYGVDARQTAYGSAFYLLSGFPWLLALVGLALVGHGQVRVWSEYADREGAMALNLQVLSLYWYFLVAAGIVVFATLVLSI
jgi:heme/copper-type cytochrome/quinol oxidase subunit 3